MSYRTPKLPTRTCTTRAHDFGESARVIQGAARRARIARRRDAFGPPPRINFPFQMMTFPGLLPARRVCHDAGFVNTGDADVASGTVKWFNPTKGYGFIQPSGGGGKDVFVHISAVERAGLSTLNEGQQVDYEIVSNRGKESAENLKVK